MAFDNVTTQGASKNHFISSLKKWLQKDVREIFNTFLLVLNTSPRQQPMSLACFTTVLAGSTFVFVWIVVRSYTCRTSTLVRGVPPARVGLVTESYTDYTSFSWRLTRSQRILSFRTGQRPFRAVVPQYRCPEWTVWEHFHFIQTQQGNTEQVES